MQAVTQNENSTAEQELIYNKRRKIIKFCLLNIDDNYLTFILGIVSAVVLEEFFDIFQKVIADNYLDFAISVVNAGLFLYICWLFLRYYVNIMGIKRKLEKKTSDGRLNYLCMNYESAFKSSFEEMERELTMLVLSAVCVFLLIFFRFVCNNMHILGF